MSAAWGSATLESPSWCSYGGSVDRRQEDDVDKAVDSSSVFVPGQPDIVHPLESLEFVMLPATGRYVPSARWLPQVEVDGQDYRCTIVAGGGQVVATAVGSGHELPTVEVLPAGGQFTDACARMPAIGSCVPGAAVETVIQHLVAEQILSTWCWRLSGEALVWADVAGGERGLWQAEPALSSSVARDVAVLCDSRADAAWVWRDGTRVPAWPADERLRHADRVDNCTWPPDLTESGKTDVKGWDG